MRQVLFFIKQLHRQHGVIIYFNQLGIVISSLFEGFGILLLIPLINLSGIFNLGGSHSYSFSFLKKWFSIFSPTVNLILILSLYLILMLGQNLFKNQQSILNMKIQQEFVRHLKEDTYKAILFSNWNFFIGKRKSDLTNIMLAEVGRVGAGTNLFFQFISSLVFTVVQMVIALFISIKMTTFILAFGILLLILTRAFLRKSNSLGKETVELSRTYLAGVTDQLNGIKDIKSNSLETIHLQWFKSISKKIEDNIVHLTRIKLSSQLIYKCSSSILIAIFLFLTIKFLKSQPTQLMLVVVIFSRLWPRISSIQSNLEQLYSNLPSFNALLELQKECKDALEIKSNIETDDVKGLDLRKGIECRGIIFSYDSHEKNALDNISLQVPANRMTAIVGRSGAGKSTLIDILMGLNRPQKGELLIDGKPLDDQTLLSLRKSISYVPQDPFVFNSSIRDNLNIVNLNAKDDELWDALEFASAADFVRKLPHKLDTLIGDRGIKLSGGERQRLVLARAILKKPSILILDEATSSLDTENESKIQDALERLNGSGSLTLIVIAHRLSTIRHADQVIVLDEGRVVQQGRYRQLAEERQGVFSQLLAKQVELKTTIS